MPRYLTLAALILVAVVVAPVTAQEARTYSLETQEGGWEIADLLYKLVELPDLNVTYDPNAPQIARKKIQFVGRVDLDRQEFFDWVRGLLFQQRIVLVPSGPANAHTYSAVDLNSPLIAQHPVHVPESELGVWKSRDGAYITTTIQLRKMKETSRARNALAQLSTRQIGRINDHPSSQSFVIADFAPVVWAMKNLLGELERDTTTADPNTIATIDPLIKSYEQKLAQCQTETAATYFVKRIAYLRETERIRNLRSKGK